MAGSERRQLLAAELLDAIDYALTTMPESPQRRLLGAKAEGYRRTIAHFRTSRPTEAQCDALDEMVLELHGKLLDVLRRSSLDLTPAPLRIDDDDEPPPSSTPFARVQLRRGNEKR